jgi:predicted DNA-binding transcriptional regulator AlpA
MLPLLTTRDVLALLRLRSRTTLYVLINDGTLPQPRKVGGKNRWLPADIERAINRLPREMADTSAATEASIAARRT